MANIDENKLVIRFKKLNPNAKTPIRMRQGDGAYDLSCIKGGIVSNGVSKFNTGIAVAIPDGYVGLLWCRGGLGMKGLDVHGGVIDSNYRGEIIVGLSNNSFIEETNDQGVIDNYFPASIEVKDGDRIAQLIIQKSEDVDFIEVDDLDDTNRGVKGFGSSDNFPQ